MLRIESRAFFDVPWNRKVDIPPAARKEESKRAWSSGGCWRITNCEILVGNEVTLKLPSAGTNVPE